MNSVQYFDSIAAKWNVIRSEYFEERLKYKLLSVDDIKDKVVADLGCGTGFVSLDGTFINMALHHVKEPWKAINEMYRVIKEDGTVVISDVMEHDGEWAREEMYDEWLGFSNEQIINWLREAGFKNIKIENTDLRCKGYSSKGEYTETGIFVATAVKIA